VEALVYSSYQALRIERRGATLWVTLDNPPVNASTPEMHTELTRVWGDIARDPQTRCVVLTGAGETFSAGGDINRMAVMTEQHELWAQSMPEARQLVLGMLDCDKPIVGRINGHAIGLGATLAVCCDITVMVETAKIADTHVSIGLAAGDGGALIWPYLVGWATAKRLLLTGEILTGRQAADLGLIGFAVPREQLDAEVETWAARLANGASQAIYGTKRALNMMLRQQAAAYMDAHLGLETMSHLSRDHREAVLAFRDKRKPVFRGD
jgi:enoyl-CoA hydratase